MSKTGGILDGMGPPAMVDLFANIVANTPAVFDQDYLRSIIDNNPKIPPAWKPFCRGRRVLCMPLAQTVVELAQQSSGRKIVETLGGA